MQEKYLDVGTTFPHYGKGVPKLSIFSTPPTVQGRRGNVEPKQGKNGECVPQTAKEEENFIFCVNIPVVTLIIMFRH